ncbi:TRAPP subunit [Entomophthora muscae]|uniref:TRAPP subunit n=1 Tax=Entomophthora muscae TaxID=34485 RepID=A0ACC2SS85_9FUNG|nr:TRAPP subunit [Entomophthora muscae]
MAHYFAIVGLKDNPIYETDLTGYNSVAKNDEHKHLNQFIVHGALDVVDDVMWDTKDLFLKNVDKFNDWQVSAYITPSCVKFMLLHVALNEDSIKAFFVDVHELYTKVLMNPFYEVDAKITCPVFDQKVLAFSKKHL